MQPLEKAIEHLNSINSAWGLDFVILREGLADAAKRIEALEKKLTPKP